MLRGNNMSTASSNSINNTTNNNSSNVLYETDDDNQKLFVNSTSVNSEDDFSLDEYLNENMGRYQYISLLALGLSNAADSTELMLISFIMPKLDFTDTMKGVLSGSMFLGMIVGGLYSGSLSGMIGRRKCLIVALLVNVVFGTLTALFPDSWEWIFFCRTVAGVGVGGTVPAMFAMASEITSQKYRGQFVNMVCICWMVGGIFTGTTAWVMLGVHDWSWRYLCVASQFPSAVALMILFMYVLETPKFYIYKKDEANLRKVLTTMAKRNGAQPPPSRPLISDATDSGIEERITFRESMRILKNLFSKRMVRTTSLLLVVWFTLSFGWYGIILWVPKLFDRYGHDDIYGDTLLVQVANLPGNIASALLVDRLGRKNLLVTSMALSCITCIVLGFQNTLTGTVILSCIYNGVSIAGWNSLGCLSPESFPTSERSTAIGLLSSVGKLASGLSQVVFGLMFHYDLPYSAILFVAAGMMLLGSLATHFLPFEPMNQSIDAVVV
eukprot:TRINITY_DN9034_c0_g1_i1.p1 TRINITY_DN9034_c0_g1~~TRINITY_DN9034_c0_g1_i1.p1  ORF type:complete len:547 (+),score=66.38 TRINITY_DN9034_c0_g1_i1:151-1641(+)